MDHSLYASYLYVYISSSKKSHRRASSSDCYKKHQIIFSYAYMDGSCINAKIEFGLVIPDRLTSNMAKKFGGP